MSYIPQRKRSADKYLNSSRTFQHQYQRVWVKSDAFRKMISSRGGQTPRSEYGRFRYTCLNALAESYYKNPPGRDPETKAFTPDNDKFLFDSLPGKVKTWALDYFTCAWMLGMDAVDAALADVEEKETPQAE